MFLMVFFKVHPERITKEDKKLVKELDNDDVDFPVQEKDFSNIKTRNNICINVFFYENKLFFQLTFHVKNLKTRWICCIKLMVINRIMCISKILTDLCFTKQKIKTKNTFVKVVYSVLVVKMC